METILLFLCNLSLYTIIKSSPSQTYDYKREEFMKQNFYPYLVNNNFENNNNCNQNSGIGSHINDSDLKNAYRKADHRIRDVLTNNTEYLKNHPNIKDFSSYLYELDFKAKFKEILTKNLILDKCLSRYEAETKFQSIRLKDNNLKNFCDSEREVSPTVKCNPRHKYSRIDGKCNNLEKTNWGSSFHCQRRLLLPDYADGVSEPRVANDGSALPDTRFISNKLMPRLKKVDSKRSQMHMFWGQYLIHDVIKTVNHFGFRIDCCAPDSKLVKQDCIIMDNFPPDSVSTALNKTCLGVPRSLICNPCTLGHRKQLSAVTSIIDLSHLYGYTQEQSNSLRTFKLGGMKGGIALDGSDILPKMNLPNDQDHFDLTSCNMPIEDRLSCLLSGDGMRGNQQPMIMALHIILHRRHMQHSRSFSKVNPHWNDETLFQEARKLLIAEVSKIHFSEYFPSVFNKQTLDYYELNVKSNGFTQYNPNVNPTTINEVNAAAFRFGHSQVTDWYQIFKKTENKTYDFLLRNKYQEMSDIWEGNTNGIIKGLNEVPAMAVAPYISPDVHDYLFYRAQNSRIGDLIANNIMRGRDHGVPAYVYFIEYCTGVRINNWIDLNQFIPEDYIKNMAKVYKDVRDVDLFVGGLAEKHLMGSILGPTFSCLIGIQAYHWKWGDRFYFEHGEQAGSFTRRQLNNIRTTSSLANLLCKTTDLESIQSKPMFMHSNTNPMILCQHLPEFDYQLWRDK